MTTCNPANPITLEAAEDLSSLQYTYISLDSDGKAISPAAITAPIVGVVQNTPGIGEEALIVPMGSGGTSKIVLGATLAAGAKVSTEAATGKAIAAASTAEPAGLLLQGGVEDDLGEVLLSSQTVDA